MDTVLVVQVSPNLYLVVGTHKNTQKIKKTKKGKKTDADTMYGNNSLTVTQK